MYNEPLQWPEVIAEYCNLRCILTWAFLAPQAESTSLELTLLGGSRDLVTGSFKRDIGPYKGYIRLFG